MDERIQRALKHPVTIPAAVGILSFAGGTAVGYFVAKRKTEVMVHEDPIVSPIKIPTLQEMMEKPEPEPEVTVKPPPVIVEAEVYENPPQIDEEAVAEAEQAADIAAEYQGDPEPEEDGDEVVSVHVFDGADENWDWDEQNAYRASLSNGEPFVITKEEYWSEESGFQQSTLTWYAGDSVLADEKNMPIMTHEIQFNSLLAANMFGVGSGDPNVFFVRIPGIQVEHEVLRSSSSHHLEVLGQDADDAADEEPPFRGRRQRLEE